MPADATVRDRPLSHIHAYIDPGTGVVLVTVGSWILALISGILGVLLVAVRRVRRWFWRNRRPLGLLLLLLLVAGAVWLGIQRSRFLPWQGRIVMLAFDGMDAATTQRLLATGRLPHLQALAERGAFRPLRTTYPAQSAVAWATFATGKNPGKHGIFDFIRRDLDTRQLSLALSQFEQGRPMRPLRTDGFWNYLSDYGIESTILGLPVAFPPDAMRGRLLAGMGVPDVLGTQGTFTFYTTEAVDGADTGGHVVRVPDTPSLTLEIRGPLLESQGAPRYATVAYEAHVAADRQTVSIRLQEQQLTLTPRTWSDWATVVFETGGGAVSSIVRFYLVATEPGLKLYVTPANIDPTRPLFPISYPDHYAADLAAEIGLFYTQGMPMDTWAVNELRLDEPAFLEQVDHVVEERMQMLDLELARFEQGLLYAYFEDLDIVQHMFYRYTDPRHPLHVTTEAEIYGPLIDDWYTRMDDIVGRVAGRLQPDDILIVLSDHGFQSYAHAVHLNLWLEQQGYLNFHAGAPEGDRSYGDIDWSRTEAYAVGFNGIYLNLAGREEGGIVSAARRPALLNELTQQLAAWTDPATEVAIFSTVVASDTLYQGPYASEAPDLFVGYNRRYRASWQTALGGAGESLVVPNLKKWSGDHLIDPRWVPGVLFANRPITAPQPGLDDMVPTLLQLVGAPAADIRGYEFDGRPLLAGPTP